MQDQFGNVVSGSPTAALATYECAIWPVLSRALLGPLDKFRGSKVGALGAAMARNLLTTGQGDEVLHWKEFAALAKQ